MCGGGGVVGGWMTDSHTQYQLEDSGYKHHLLGTNKAC